MYGIGVEISGGVNSMSRSREKEERKKERKCMSFVNGRERKETIDFKKEC